MVKSCLISTAFMKPSIGPLKEVVIIMSSKHKIFLFLIAYFFSFYIVFLFALRRAEQSSRPKYLHSFLVLSAAIFSRFFFLVIFIVGNFK